MWDSHIAKALCILLYVTWQFYLVQKTCMMLVPTEVCTAEFRWDGLGTLFSGLRLKFVSVSKSQMLVQIELCSLESSLALFISN